MNTEEQVKKLTALINAGKRLAVLTDIDELLAELSDCAKEICDSEWASILLIDDTTNELYFKTAVGGQANLVKTIRLSMGTGIAGWVAQQNKPLIVNDVANDPRFFGNINDKFKIETRNILAVPVNFGGRTIGVIEVGNKKNDELYTESEKSYLEVISSQAGIAINNSFLVGSLNNFKIHSLEIIVAAIDEISPFNEGHSIDVARVATSITRELGLPETDYQNIYYASLLHDIGFLRNIPEIDTKHPAIGYSLLEHIEALKDIPAIIVAHHEKYDGTGFPHGLTGKDIPQGARIVGFAEAFVEYANGFSIANPFMNLQHFDNNVVVAANRLMSQNGLR